MRLIVATLILMLAGTARAGDLDTVFTYQGQLKEGGIPYPSDVDLRFSLYDHPDLGQGNLVGGPVTFSNHALDNGVFTVGLDFGEQAFDGNNRWLEIEVAAPAGGSFATLNPRQQVTAVPYALERSLIHIDETNQRVGVGTTIPNVSFESVGWVRASRDVDPDQYIELRSSSSSGIWLTAHSRESNKKVLSFTNVHDESGSPAGESYMRFRLGPASAPLEAMTIKESGLVGIGNTNPDNALLHVGSGDATQLKLGNDPELIFGREVANNKFRIAIGGNNWDGNVLQLGRDPGANTHDIYMTGKVGIGEPASLAALHVQNGERSLQAAAVENDGVIVEAQDAVIGLYSTAQGSWGSALALKEIDGSGAIVDAWGIARQTSAASSPSSLRITYGPSDNYAANPSLFHFNTDGEFVAAGNGTDPGVVTTDVLRITGGADLSEQFDIDSADGSPEPGTVVCIDSSRPGRLVVSRKAYDATVAGVVSGAGGVRTGMLMGQEGSAAGGEHPVALTGRVYVKATIAGGTIRPGDLLTTSDRPGHAMRATDRDRSHGAILGKAMSGLEEGAGLVLVLVNLQ